MKQSVHFVTKTLNDGRAVKVSWAFPNKHRFTKNQRVTVAKVHIANEYYKGVSIRDNRDTFSKVRGAKIALSNTFKDIKSLNKADRRMIWSEVLRVNPNMKD